MRYKKHKGKYFYEGKSLLSYCEEHNIPYDTVYSRLQKGLSIEGAIKNLPIYVDEPLSVFCKKNNVDKSAVLYRMKRYGMLKEEAVEDIKNKTKISVEECKERMKIYNRKRRGWSEEDALLPDNDFRKLSASKRGQIFVNGLNLKYVCEKLRLKYNSVFVWLKRHKNSTPQEYFEMKGINYDDVRL